MQRLSFRTRGLDSRVLSNKPELHNRLMVDSEFTGALNHAGHPSTYTCRCCTVTSLKSFVTSKSRQAANTKAGSKRRRGLHGPCETSQHSLSAQGRPVFVPPLVVALLNLKLRAGGRRRLTREIRMMWWSQQRSPSQLSHADLPIHVSFGAVPQRRYQRGLEGGSRRGKDYSDCGSPTSLHQTPPKKLRAAGQCYWR